MTPTDDLAAVVRDEAERCGVDVRELARAPLGWSEIEMTWARLAALGIAAVGRDLRKATVALLAKVKRA